MKTTVDGVEITLTSKQIAIIAKETKKIKTITNFRDIKTFEDACEVLPEDYKVFKKCYKLLSKDTLNYERLRIIIKAINLRVIFLILIIQMKGNGIIGLNM